MRSLLLRAASAAALFALVACGGGGETGGTQPPPVDNTPASIALTASATTIQSGSTAVISAAVTNKSGGSITSPTIVWTTSDASIASVTGGIVSGLKLGTATITATAGAVSATASITVTPGNASQLVIRTQPIGSRLGQPLATQPVVEIRDPNNNLVSSTAAVTAAIASGGGAITGTTTVSAVGGIATFSDLSITGTDGNRTLSFTSPGLLSTTSSTLTMTAPPTQTIVVDRQTVALTTPRGINVSSQAISITNGGSLTVTSLAVSAVTYDAGQPTGWLSVALSGSSAPATATLSFATTGLAEGSYRAAFNITAPGATNPTVPVTVTLTVTQNYTVTYGSNTEKVKIVDVGGSFLPTTTVADPVGVAVPGVALTYTTRSPSIATVGADGRIAARAPGDAWIVVTSTLSRDSIFVIVPANSTGPVIRAANTTWAGQIGDTLLVNIVLDMRGGTVGAASLAIDDAVPVQGFYQAAAGPPVPVVTLNNAGVLRVTVGDGAGMTGTVQLLTLKLISRTAAASGYIYLYALDVVGVDGSDMTSRVSSTRFPVVIR